MRNMHRFMSRKNRGRNRGALKRPAKGIGRAIKLDRSAFAWRRSLGMTRAEFNEYLVATFD